MKKQNIAIEATRVSPGILPPIMRITPNSPMVCAKVSMAAEIIEGRTLGINTR